MKIIFISFGYDTFRYYLFYYQFYSSHFSLYIFGV